MVRGMLAGLPLEKALRAAWADPVVKDRYLVTPLQRRTLSKRPAPPAGGEAKKPKQENRAEPRGQGKGGGGNGGKGGGKKEQKGKRFSTSSSSGCAAATTSGSRICFAFNNRSEGCKRGAACPFAHVCGVCFAKDVPMFDCKHQGMQ